MQVQTGEVGPPDIFGEDDPFAAQMANAEEMLIADRSVGVRAFPHLLGRAVAGELPESFAQTRIPTVSTAAYIGALPMLVNAKRT